ncbi:hypothetical protein CJ030_MR7G000063 [Morella rubra]|uniref:Uncharacterized protein n=1 Tax=Morella rubra TaxID=262757 RepID=A0A6A1V1L7_9ROSI|nr:hypothetical protein CJ030_MR7G000064 [Morella rubra]KAB1206481.1 hypothetical protein CJ030_MR7G000063 [Morella rubra]
MAVATGCRFPPAFPYLASSARNPQKPINSLLCPSSFIPISASKTNPSIALSRPRIFHATVVAPKRASRLSAVAGVVEDSSEAQPESEPNVSYTVWEIHILLSSLAS